METSLPRPIDLTISPDISLNHTLLDFFTREASLLDDRRFEEWLELLAEDIGYIAPGRINRLKTDDHLSDFLPITQGAHFNDNKTTLSLRVQKTRFNTSWCEDPRTRTRLCISNLIARRLETEGEFESTAYFQYFRSRMSKEPNVMVGKRVDRVRRNDKPLGFEIFSREIYFDHDVMFAGGISTFL